MDFVSDDRHLETDLLARMLIGRDRDAGTGLKFARMRCSRRFGTRWILGADETWEEGQKYGRRRSGEPEQRARIVSSVSSMCFAVAWLS